MNEALYDEDGNFVGFCYTHQGRRVLTEDTEGCQHETCIDLRNKPDTNKGPMWNINRFKHENQGGYTQSELEKDTIEAAKRDGREISRVK